MTERRIVTLLVAAVMLVGCGGAPLRFAAIDDMERVRAGAGAREGATLAPEAYAHAEQERNFAHEAHASGDDIGATLHAERAVVAYGHALAIARMARATVELADAQKALDDATTQEASLEASRARLDREADELEQRLRLARERMFPASATAAAPEREAARVVAARSLAMQGKLLCGAAHLVAPDAVGLTDADKEIAALAERPGNPPRPTTIDEAARARAHCLDVLTRARRGAGYDPTAADELLAELSAAGGWDPGRDERGVIVTLHDGFRGTEPTERAAARLKELAGVASAHPLLRVQLVVHDARAPAANDTTDAKRADAAVRALVQGGANASRIRTELAGALAPVVDPSDPKGRGRNERLEVVFVSGGEGGPHEPK